MKALTHRTLSLVMTASLLIGLVGPAWAGEPTEFVKQRTEKVAQTLSKKESKKRVKELDALVQESIDFRELASRSLKGYWEKRTPEEQQEFLTLLQELLQANYEGKLKGKTLDKDYKIEYGDEKTRDNLAIVRTKVIVKADFKPVAYKLLQREDKTWVVYDIVIDDISLEETYRESYTEIIKDEGWASLIDRMKARAKELRNPPKAAKAAPKSKK